MPLLHAYNHASIDFHFNSSARDFCVHEVPFYEFSNTGEHAVIQVRKSGLSTLEMLQIFFSNFRVNPLFCELVRAVFHCVFNGWL